MSYIYKISNLINGKNYIGKTNFSIEKRFKEHCCDAYKENENHRPLYAAMRKYGIENFVIELIEETDNPEEREQFWIKYYNTYENGYNATKGGDGKMLFDHQYIIQLLNINPRPVEIAKIVGCSVDLIYKIAKEHNIKMINKGQEDLIKNSKQIFQFSKNNELLNIFNSTQEAAEWCYNNQKCATLNSGVRSHISEVANGKRKSAYGYIWKY